MLPKEDAAALRAIIDLIIDLSLIRSVWLRVHLWYHLCILHCSTMCVGLQCMSVVSLLLLLGVVAEEEFFELVEVRGAVSFLQRAARAAPAAIDHPATLYALPLAATFRPRDYVRVLLRKKKKRKKQQRTSFSLSFYI